MNEKKIQDKFDNIIDILVKKFNAPWIHEITLEIHPGGHTYMFKNGMTVHLSLEKVNIAKEDGGFREYKIVLDRINIDYHTLPKQGRYIITNDVATWMMIHEISHILAFQKNSDIEPHGKEFCDVYDTVIYYINPHTRWVFND